MTKKTATAERQSDLLGATAPKPEPAKAEKPAKTKTALAVVPPPEPKNLLAIIYQAVADPRCDTAKMRELLTMQREVEERNEAREFNVALLAAQNEIPKIVKDRQVESKYRYATLEKVSKEVDHIARKHGFSMTFGTDDSPLKDHYRIVCDLAHVGGHVRRYKIDLKCDDVGAKGTSNKTAVQGVGSTTSYGRRYLKVMMFDLIIVGEDTDGNRNKADVIEDAQDGEALISNKQMDDLVKAIADCGVGVPRFCKTYKIEKVADLPAEFYDRAMKSCAQFKAPANG
jgi:hypothetical protein